MMIRTLSLAALVLLAFAAAATAQSGPNHGLDGKKLADQYCARCHTIVAGEGSWTDAPTFQAIANRPGLTAPHLSKTIQGPHMDMLNDRRSPAQADAIAAYILTLRVK